MATGTVPRYDIACDLAPGTPDGVSTQVLICCGGAGDVLDPGCAGGPEAADPEIRSFGFGFGAVSCA